MQKIPLKLESEISTVLVTNAKPFTLTKCIHILTEFKLVPRITPKGR